MSPPARHVPVPCTPQTFGFDRMGWELPIVKKIEASWQLYKVEDGVKAAVESLAAAGCGSEQNWAHVCVVENDRCLLHIVNVGPVPFEGLTKSLVICLVSVARSRASPCCAFRMYTHKRNGCPPCASAGFGDRD